MKQFFQVIFYQPIFNIFVGLYVLIPDVGVVILVLTLLIKIILYPLTKKSITVQKSLSELQPKLEELKAQHKDNQQQLAQEKMKLYREHKVNALGSCLPILVQLPVFLALFYVLRDGFSGSDFQMLYSFVPNPESINPVSFGLFDLGKPSVVLAVLAGAAQFWQTKMMTRKRPPPEAGKGGKDENMMTMMNKQMLYMMPVFTVIVGIQFPGGLALYWFLSTLFTGLQQMIQFRNHEHTKT